MKRALPDDRGFAFRSRIRQASEDSMRTFPRACSAALPAKLRRVSNPKTVAAPGGAKSRLLLRLPSRPMIGRRCWSFLRNARAIAGIRGASRTAATVEPSTSMALQGTVSIFAPPGANALSRRRSAFPKLSAAAGHHRAAAPRCSNLAADIRCPFRPISRTDPAAPRPLVATRPGACVCLGAWDGFELAIRRRCWDRQITVSAGRPSGRAPGCCARASP